jgi:CRP/FNR family transcriptional regulator
MKTSHRDPATFNLRMIKNKKETDVCPTRKLCVELWGSEELFCSIRNLTKFELIYKENDFIYKTGDPVTSLYVIQTGAVKLEKNIYGSSNNVNSFYFTGELIGAESLGFEQHQYSAIALKETWVCEIRLQKLAMLGESTAAILHKINTLLSQHLCELDEHHYNNSHLHLEPRLLNFLNVVCKKNLDSSGKSLNRLNLPLTKKDIASYLGMRQESISRALRQLKNKGIVLDSMHKRTLVIDRKKLLDNLDFEKVKETG